MTLGYASRLFALWFGFLLVVKEDEGEEEDAAHHAEGGGVVRERRRDKPLVLRDGTFNDENMLKLRFKFKGTVLRFYMDFPLNRLVLGYTV